jgi:hypothetical protein
MGQKIFIKKPYSEKLIEITYKIYSENYEISFEDYINDIVMDNNNNELFNELLEQSKIIYNEKKSK